MHRCCFLHKLVWFLFLNQNSTQLPEVRSNQSDTSAVKPNNTESVKSRNFNQSRGNGVEYVQIKLIVNSLFSNAEIFIDGKAAVVTNNTLTVKTIKIQNNKSHSFKLIENNDTCFFNTFINQSGQQIVASCK